MNTTNYPLTIKHTVDNIIDEYKEDNEFVQYYQYVVREYLVKTDTRGLLVYHSTGVGKSITAAAITDYYRKYDPKRKIIVLLSKSLQSNFENNVRKYMRNNPNNVGREKSGDFIDEALEVKYNFVSLNASNMFTQLSRINKAVFEDDFDKKIGVFNDQVKGMLENSLLVVDEFHNLSNAITNGSKNAVKLYNTIMNTKNIKLIFLTGTPIINNPFELVPTFNLLKGYIYDFKHKYTLFPENQQDFDKFFIKKKDSKDDIGKDAIKEESNKAINNKAKFQNRIFGLVSYYGDRYFDKSNKEEFPTQKETIIDRVPMSLYQFGRYQEAREIELKEESSKFKKANVNEYFAAKDASKSISSYRIRSRQISNYFIPEYALTFKNKRTSVIKHIHKIKEQDLKDLDKYSPKFKRILENINKHPNTSGVVYSEFVSGEGLALFSMILDRFDYVFWEKSKNFVDKLTDDYVLTGDNEPLDAINNATSNTRRTQKTYALITGDIPMAERQNVINVFNSPENVHGVLISLLLISKSGAEGLNLKNVRHIHVMEPFWNYARIEQIIARGVRFQSHMLLPKSERNVQPYIYISIYPKAYTPKNKERTTDEEIYSTALNGKILRDDFEIAMVESSIDCSIHYKKLEKPIQDKLFCYLCAPTEDRLYDADIYTDMKKPNPCKHISNQKEIKAKEIIVSINGVDTTFYYSKLSTGEIRIYKFSDDVGGYMPLKKNYPFYADIVTKIMNFKPV